MLVPQSIPFVKSRVSPWQASDFPGQIGFGLLTSLALSTTESTEWWQNWRNREHAGDDPPS
jgi:hypothetical protein